MSDHRVARFPMARKIIVDITRLGQRKHIIHGLVEVDVTKPRGLIRAHKEKTGETISFTAFIIHCLARAVGEDTRVQAYRDWRDRLVMFEDVDVNTLVEHDIGGEKMATVYIVRAANRKTVFDIHREIRAAQAAPFSPLAHRAWLPYFFLPDFMHDWFWQTVFKLPRRVKQLAGTVAVTAVGMFGDGKGWGIGIHFHTLTLTVGGITRAENREQLCLTISCDHDIVDGAPAARFSKRLKELIEDGSGLAFETTAGN